MNVNTGNDNIKTQRLCTQPVAGQYSGSRITPDMSVTEYCRYAICFPPATVQACYYRIHYNLENEKYHNFPKQIAKARTQIQSSD